MQDAELIFKDEDDKFYVGTPTEIGEVDPGRNSVVGEFEILCVDPFKYSVTEYEAEAWEEDPSSVLIDYGGTYKAFPTLVSEFYKETEVADDGETATALTGAGDCGYVAFFNEDEQIIQMGNPDEADVENAKPQTLINQMFKVSTAWGAAGKAPWGINSAPAIDKFTQVGTIGIGIAEYAVPATPKTTEGTLLKSKQTTVSEPDFYYTVKAKASGRTSSSVKIEVAITTSLENSSSYFGKGYGLEGQLYMGGSWHEVTIKKTSSYWTGKSGHTANMSFTVSGLSASTTSLTGIKFKTVRTDGLGSAGTLDETSCSDLTISPYVSDTPESYYLTATGYGTGESWHGPSITRNLTADSNGEVGATDFVFNWRQKMCIGNGATSQLGGLYVRLSDADGAEVAGVRIRKSYTGKTATLLFYVEGATVFQTAIDLTSSGKLGAKDAAASKIEKDGNTVYFDVAGHSAATVSDTITDKAVTKVTFVFEAWSTRQALAFNGITEVKFNKTHYDIPNSFSANDVLEADCKNGDIYLNGLLTPELGALGNNWEGFYLRPGLNQIGVSYSNWVETAYAPTIKVRYREVFL